MRGAFVGWMTMTWSSQWFEKLLSMSVDAFSSMRSRFPNLDWGDTLDQIFFFFFFCVSPVLCIVFRVFGTIPGLCQLDASSTSPMGTIKISPKVTSIAAPLPLPSWEPPMWSFRMPAVCKALYVAWFYGLLQSISHAFSFHSCYEHKFMLCY